VKDLKKYHFGTDAPKDFKPFVISKAIPLSCHESFTHYYKPYYF